MPRTRAAQKSTSPSKQEKSAPSSTKKSQSPGRSRSKSPARNQRKSEPAKKREKTPTREKSPSRSRSRSQSPARESKKSESKVVRRTKQVDSESEVVAKNSTKTEVSDLAVKSKKQVKSEHTEKSVKQQNDVATSPAKPKKKLFTQINELGLFFAYHVKKILMALFTLITLNGFLLYIQLNCGKGVKSCMLSRVPQLPANITSYCDANVLLSISGFFVFQALLTLLPIGKVVDSSKGYSYRVNGLFAYIITCASAGVLLYLGYPVQHLYTQQFKYSVATAAFALILTLVLFVKSFFAKLPRGHLVDEMFCGKEANPRMGKVDFKSLTTFRFGHTLSTLSYMAFVYVDYQSKKGQSVNQVLLMATSMQIVYSLLVQLLEEDLLFSSLMKEDKLSYARIFHFAVAMPFIFTLPGRYILEHYGEIEMPFACALGCFIPFLAGAFMFYKSNHEKGMFKRDPDHPKVSHLLSVTSGRGDREVKFLCSGMFRIVRHPNYFGDLSMNLALALLTGFTTPVTYLPFAYLTLVSLYRICVMEKLMSTRSMYSSSAWDQYKKFVPKRLIVKIF